MTINTTGQWADTNYTRFNLANGLRVQLGSEAGSQEMTFEAYDTNGSGPINITEEITGEEGLASTARADNLLYWLSLARDWKPEADQSCENQIDDYLNRQLADMRKLHNLQDIDEDEWDEDDFDRAQYWNDNWGEQPGGCLAQYEECLEIAENHEFKSFTLSVQKKTVYDIQCSWGGPSDGFLVGVDEGEIDSITYYFKDWFDGAQKRLSGDDFETAKRYIEGVVYLEE